MLRAITLDFWDTLYTSAVLPERVTLRQTALRRLLEAVGARATDEEIRAVYRASGAEADRWWREEQRGYTSAERIRWMLRRLNVDRPEGCEHVAREIASAAGGKDWGKKKPIVKIVKVVKPVVKKTVIVKKPVIVKKYEKKFVTVKKDDRSVVEQLRLLLDLNINNNITFTNNIPINITNTNTNVNTNNNTLFNNVTISPS